MSGPAPEPRRDEALAPSSPDENDLNNLLNSWDEGRERGRRPRLATFSYTGLETYHLVVVTHHRDPVLIGDVAIATAALLARAAASTAFELLVYTVMPDHVHILGRGTQDDANAKGFMQRFKQVSSYAYRQETGRQLWQQSFFDRVMRKTDDIDGLARYIIGNPLRAGLIAVGEDWPHEGGTMVADDGGRS